MPPAAGLAELITEPLFLESFWAGLGFMIRRMRNHIVPAKDMSVADWLYDISGSRTVADNLASAMIHGIYGGDIYRLSARSVLDRFYWAYYLPKMGPGMRHMPEREQKLMSALSEDPEIRKLALRPKGSLLHFGEAGMESMTKALADVLQNQPNVEVKLGEPITQIDFDKETQKVQVRPLLVRVCRTCYSSLTSALKCPDWVHHN